MWRSKFLDNGFAPTIFSSMRNSLIERDFPCNKHVKNEFCGGSSNNSFDFKIEATSKMQKNHNKDPIVKLGFFGHNSFEY